MTRPIRLAGIFLTAALFSHGLTLWILGKSACVLGWVLRLGWLGVGLFAIRQGGAWEELWRQSAVGRWWEKRRGLLAWTSRRF